MLFLSSIKVPAMLIILFICCAFFWNPGANADIHVIPKIESADSIPNLQSIIAASDGVRSLELAVLVI
jgi:hypothetical protein